MQGGIFTNKNLPLIFSYPHFSKRRSPLLLYLSDTGQVMSSVLIQETNKSEHLVYFVRKVFEGAMACYHKIDKLAMVIAFMMRKLLFSRS